MNVDINSLPIDNNQVLVIRSLYVNCGGGGGLTFDVNLIPIFSPTKCWYIRFLLYCYWIMPRMTLLTSGPNDFIKMLKMFRICRFKTYKPGSGATLPPDNLIRVVTVSMEPISDSNNSIPHFVGI